MTEKQLLPPATPRPEEPNATVQFQLLRLASEQARDAQGRAIARACRKVINALKEMAPRAPEAPTADAARSASPRPKIICLCGSTKFIDLFAVYTWELELQGFIVLGCTLLPSWYCPVRDHFAENQGVKPQRDAHHLQKIDLADEVLVLNVGGYIGESTRNEIAYATSKGKPVKYLEPVVSDAERATRSDVSSAGSPQNLMKTEIDHA